MALHKKAWPRRTWLYPRVHDHYFGFGLDMDDTAATKNSTMVPLAWMDNALIDYETIKTNPENADFLSVDNGACALGSYVPKVTVQWLGWSPSAEVDVMRFMTLDIHTAMLNRLDAFDKLTGNDIETILELTHETTDEQAHPLFNTVKLYEGHRVVDYNAVVEGLTGTQQPEGVAFALDGYFNALHYYSNKEMLRTVTDRMKTFYVNGDLTKAIPFKNKVVRQISHHMPSICKYMQPYTLFAKLFTVPQTSSAYQMNNAADTSAIEHLTISGHVRFNEYNPDFNFSRA